MEGMIPLEEIYGDRFFRKRNSLNWRAKIICEAVWGELRPASVIDVGCAIGDLVAGFLEIGIGAYGLEGSSAAEPYLEVDRDLVYFDDLREPIEMDPFGLVTCFEVAEHIEPKHADQFVKNLAGMSDRLLLSIAPPGQGGHYHVNCRPIEYWIDKFNPLGYAPDVEVATRIKDRLAPWKSKPGIKAIYQNLAYFEREI